MRFMRFFLIIVSTFIFNAATFAAINSSTVYTENKLAIVATPDKPSFTIKLQSNPTTGYSWYLRGYDASLVTAQTHHFQAATRQLVGAPGYELWTFHVKPAGFTVPQQTVIRFVYARPWEATDDSKELVFRVSTSVKSSNQK
jgi:inhibitor of cysteine peptidase